MQIKVVLPGSVDWDSAVQLVTDKYRTSFNAEVRPEPNCFIACMRMEEDGSQTAVAVAGVTYTDSRRLFSEQYMPAPAEVMLRDLVGKDIPREAIIEVGSLAARQSQAGSELVRAMPLICWCLGKRYVLCTSTRQLRLLFDKCGINFTPMLQPNADLLDEAARARWGTYYQQGPETGFISLEQTALNFAHHTGRYAFNNMMINLMRPTQRKQEAEYAMA